MYMAQILIIDDDRLICDMLQTILTQRKHDVVTAIRGSQGLRLFRELRPQFTLLDLRMPEMNGIEVLREIRKIDRIAPVMILTGWGSDEMENEARALGVSDFLCKGLSLEMLVSTVDRVLQRSKASSKLPNASVSASRGQPATGHYSPAQLSRADAIERGDSGRVIFWRAASQIRILLVDDDPEIRRLLEQFLTLRDYQVLMASDGLAGLVLAEQEQPDCVVLDLYMPGMNGVEVLRELRKKGYCGAVLILSASQDQALLQEAMKLGAVDMIGKPVDLELLVSAIKLRTVRA
jgi:DNA-binding response OmpR family regulator